ncbi:class I peptide chain release factor [Actinidia rufa]|uniref:Class I peptide chain release factor n=1 Tax=Actinidia rufa TaxID=165716 RepID=A0A7J0DK20_9ERIC|nr:class I peptide chain release factor [Actinidia rufa]
MGLFGVQICFKEEKGNLMMVDGHNSNMEQLRIARRNGSSSNSTVVSSTSPWDDDHRFHSRNFTSIVKLGYATRNQGNNGNGIVQGIWFSKYATATVCGGYGRQFLGMTDEELMRECDMDTFKASGPGGQHRNKRESAVRLKHLPTGVVAQAVEDRSQHKNRAAALARLRTLLALKGGLKDVCCPLPFLY